MGEEGDTIPFTNTEEAMTGRSTRDPGAERSRFGARLSRGMRKALTSRGQEIARRISAVTGVRARVLVEERPNSGGTAD